jgi:hypothetical protein
MALTPRAASLTGAPIATGDSLRANMKLVAYWLTLGAAAGGLGGVLVGGVGGRIAMFALRLTSDDSVRGVESDDGFIIGRFDFTDTGQLLLTTAVMGALVGLIVVAGRPFFPRRGMPFAWALAGAIAGGAILISGDGVDFTLLGPRPFAIALFIVIPAAGAGLIALLTELFPRFWWRQRWPTAAATLGAIPAVIFFPVAVMALVVGGLWALAMLSPTLRRFPAWKPARVAAIIVFAAVTLLGLADLIGDFEDIL